MPQEDKSGPCVPPFVGAGNEDVRIRDNINLIDP